MNYTLSEIATLTGGRLEGADLRVGRVMTDSRHSFAPEQSPMFVAIGGVNHDGHAFIDDLYRRGLRAFMVERELDFKAWPEAGFVVVERSLYALQKVATDHRSHFRGKIMEKEGMDDVPSFLINCNLSGSKQPHTNHFAITSRRQREGDS